MKKIIIIICIIVVLIFSGMLVINNYYIQNNKAITVGLVLNGEISDKNWGQSHYDSLTKTCNELGVELVYSENNTAETVSGAVDELIEQGSSIVICNSFGFGEKLPEIAEKYPEVCFFHATGVWNSENVATYFGRIYQMRYLCGIVAGLQTETNEVGYVAAFPISEVNRGINAFTLGVRSVNPNAKVYVRWTNSWTDNDAATEATQKLINDHGVDVITVHTDSLAPLDVADKSGVMSIGYNYDNSSSYPDTYLTAAVWSWENFYTPHISQCLEGKFEGKNYWDGVNTGIISLAPLTENVKEGISDVVEAEKQHLSNGTFDVFYGPICDNEGNIRVAEGESMSDDAMLNSFDWYVEGVVIDEE